MIPRLSPIAVGCCLLLFANTSFLFGFGEISSNHFKDDGTIVWGEISGCEGGIHGLVVRQEDWSYSGLSSKGSVLLDGKVVSNAWDLRFGGIPFRRALYSRPDENNPLKYQPPTEAELKAAQKKDAERAKKIRAALAAELKRAKLIYDPKTEMIVYFHVGKAKMRVLESLQGNLKAGDEIEVTWSIQDRTSCPPIIPFNGKSVGVFPGKIEKGTTARVGHIFLDLDEAKKAKAVFLKNAQKWANQKTNKLQSEAKK